MRRGCIALEDVQCDRCHRIIPNAERYLAIDEEDGVEVAKGKLACYCLECALEKGYARYQEDKGGRELTFFS